MSRKRDDSYLFEKFRKLGLDALLGIARKWQHGSDPRVLRISMRHGHQIKRQCNLHVRTWNRCSLGHRTRTTLNEHIACLRVDRDLSLQDASSKCTCVAVELMPEGESSSMSSISASSACAPEDA